MEEIAIKENDLVLAVITVYKAESSALLYGYSDS
jgi:hypothetical protein